VSFMWFPFIVVFLLLILSEYREFFVLIEMEPEQ